MCAARNFAILLFDDVEVLDFCGPFEVFSVASNQSETSSLNVYTVAEKTRITARNGLSVNADYLLESCPKPEILLIPGGSGSRKQIKNQSLLNWVSRSSEKASLILSVCTGALILGKTGLLDGLEVTTHRNAYDELREIVPTASVKPDRRFIDNGRIITSAGIAAGIDMSLHVVSRLLGAQMAESTARHMEYQWKPETHEKITTDADLIVAFENCSLPSDQFTHQAHVRVAFLYDSRYGFEAATRRVRGAIKRYNKATGTTEAIDKGYHETMTQAFMRLVSAANAQSGPYESSADFCNAHPELMTKKALRRYYSTERIMTWEAKANFVEPDLAPLPVVSDKATTHQSDKQTRDRSTKYDYSVIPMSTDHVPEVVDLWQATEGLILTYSDNRIDLAHYFSNNPGMSFVAVVRNRMVGAVLCGHDGRRGYLHHLAVAVEARNQGIGRALVNTCLSKLAETGIRQCNLFVKNDNVCGKKFWTDDGWAEWPDIRLMSKRIEEV